MNLDLRRIDADGLPPARDLLIGLYTEIYADRRDDPFFSQEKISARLDIHASCDAWEAVIAHDNSGAPVGYAYAARLPAGSGWWNGVEPAPSAAFKEEDGSRTLALFELMVRDAWRGTGAAKRVHDALLAPRGEERVTLMVESGHEGVKRLYGRWGYAAVGIKQPFPQAPRYTVMVRSGRGA